MRQLTIIETTEKKPRRQMIKGKGRKENDTNETRKANLRKTPAWAERHTTFLSQVHSFSYSFLLSAHGYLSSISHVPGTELGAGKR